MKKELAMKKAYQTASNFTILNCMDDDIKALVLENQVQSYMKKHDIKVTAEEVKAYVKDCMNELKMAAADFAFEVRM